MQTEVFQQNIFPVGVGSPYYLSLRTRRGCGLSGGERYRVVRLVVLARFVSFFGSFFRFVGAQLVTV